MAPVDLTLFSRSRFEANESPFFDIVVPYGAQIFFNDRLVTVKPLGGNPLTNDLSTGSGIYVEQPSDFALKGI